ncbi:hypothetical protein Hanom_Chr15g01392891 [Helianthus anomalus]
MVVVSRRTVARNRRNSERDDIVGGIPAMVDVGASTMEVVRRNHDDGSGSCSGQARSTRFLFVSFFGTGLEERVTRSRFGLS